MVSSISFSLFLFKNNLFFNYQDINGDTNSNNTILDIDISSSLAKETSIINAKSASIDHTYKIKQQNESQLKQQQQQQQQRKRTKTTTDSASDDESKNKKLKKNTSNELQTSIIVDNKQQQQNDEPTFTPGEFLIHRSTFQDYDNYDIWCVRDDGYLQKYEPVYLSTGERCHQSADILAQYTPDKSEFVVVKVEEKGKTEQNNVVVSVLNEYEPKNNLQLVIQSTNNQEDEEVDEEGVINKNKKLAVYDELKPTFDIFLQILLSQFINSEFLFKIKEIQGKLSSFNSHSISTNNFSFFSSNRRLL
jgi:hypothetical protein